MTSRALLLAAVLALGAAPVAVADERGGGGPEHGHGHGHGHHCQQPHSWTLAKWHAWIAAHQHQDRDCGDGGGEGGGGGPGGATGGGAAGSGTGALGSPGANGMLGVTQVSDLIAPVLSLPKLSPRIFRAARRGASIAVRTGTTLSYTLSEPARVRFTVQKRRYLSRVCREQIANRSRHRTGTRCRRWIFIRGSFAKNSPAGPTELRFRGRLRGRTLRPGSYRLVATATDAAGNRTTPLRPTFRIVR